MLLVGLGQVEYCLHTFFAVYLDDLSLEPSNIKAGIILVRS